MPYEECVMYTMAVDALKNLALFGSLFENSDGNFEQFFGFDFRWMNEIMFLVFLRSVEIVRS